MKNHLYLTFIFLWFLLISCEGIFQYNPNQIVLKDSERNLTEKALERLKSLPVKDTVRFIVMGDSQRWYDETEHFVKSANKQKGISFVVHAGDISDFGLSQEFRWVHNIMSKLEYPYLTVVGNHDAVANGPIVYRKMYGPLNYSFEFGANRFIMLNTNSREYEFDGTTPDLGWLKAELANNPDNKNVIVIAHVPPFDADFDPNMENEYANLLANNPNVKFTIYGHQHIFKDGFFYEDGVRYLVTTSMGERGYLIVSTWEGGYKIEQVEF